MTEDNKVVRLIDKLRTKALATSLRRMLARTVREMKDEGATPAEIVQVLRETAEDLDNDGKKPA